MIWGDINIFEQQLKNHTREVEKSQSMLRVLNKNFTDKEIYYASKKEIAKTGKSRWFVPFTSGCGGTVDKLDLAPLVTISSIL
jgi:hypothetical protein